MEAASLIKLERIANNLPALDIEFGKVNIKLGEVFIAVGRGEGILFPGMAWHGVYGFEYGDHEAMGRTGESPGELTLKEARQQLLDDAAMQMALFNVRGMLDSSYSLEHS